MEIVRGDTYRISFGLYDDADQETVHEMAEGEKLNFTCKTSVDNVTAVIEKHYPDDIEYNSAIEKYEFELDADETKNLRGDCYIFDVEFVSANGDVKTLHFGEVSVVKDVTLPYNRG